MSNSIVGEIYQDIISDVIQASQHDFEEYGIDASVLAELKEIWQARLATTNVARFPWTESLVTDVELKPKSEPPLLSNPAMSAMRAAQQIQQLAQAQQTRFYTEALGTSHDNHLPQSDGLSDLPKAFGSPNQLNKETNSLNESVNMVPNESSVSANISVGISSSDSNGTSSQALFDGLSTLLTTRQIDASLNEALLKMRKGSIEAQKVERSVGLSLRLLRQAVPLVQTDGMDSDSINSDLDSELNSNPEDNSEHDDNGQLVLCLYDKVQRTKNKWKCVLKDGIIGMGGKDYLFMRANGEFEW